MNLEDRIPEWLLCAQPSSGRPYGLPPGDRPAVPADGARAPDGFRMGRQGVLLVGGSPWLVALPVPLALGPQGLLPGGSAVATDPGALPVPSCFFLCRDLSDPHN